MSMSRPRDGEQHEGIDFGKILFIATALLTLSVISFAVGVTVADQRFPIYTQLRDSAAVLREYFQGRPEILEPRRYQGRGVTRYDPDQAYNGLTLLQGMFAEGVELRLVDMVGNVIHRWPADFFDVWPEPDHVVPEQEVPKSRFDYHTHGMWAYPDGSVVFNFGELGTVKMDKCGEIEWTLERMNHHSITPAADGSLWIPTKADVRDVPQSLWLPEITRSELLNSRGWYEDRLLNVNAHGQIVEEVSLLPALFEGGFDTHLFDAAEVRKLDPTHVNDVEVVTRELDSKIPGVEAGDLLVSVRQMHMLLIIDREDGVIKWHKVGPWIRQHDPDITPEGNILVFSNRTNGTAGQFQESSVMLYDPARDMVSIVYPRDENDSFYSYIMGALQLLTNGNILIAESMNGRVFEINAQGQIVWEYVMPYDDDHAAVIEQAVRFPSDYFQVGSWEC